MTSTIAPPCFDRVVADPEFHIRLENDDVAVVSAADMNEAMMAEAIPWRTFRWYFGQCHYSGAYWSATEQAHVIHESRLELSRLLLADFDADVSHIVAQPFLMKAKVDGVRRRHIPDYYLATSGPPTVVFVKPADQLDDPKVIDIIAWVRQVIESMGWRFEIATEQPPTLLENIRFLAGYRRAAYVAPSALEELRSLNLVGMTFGHALRKAKGPAPLIRSALLHMLWSHELTADLSQALTAQTILTEGPKK
jgi:hypothetical protein